MLPSPIHKTQLSGASFVGQHHWWRSNYDPSIANMATTLRNAYPILVHAPRHIGKVALTTCVLGSFPSLTAFHSRTFWRERGDVKRNGTLPNRVNCLTTVRADAGPAQRRLERCPAGAAANHSITQTRPLALNWHRVQLHQTFPEGNGCAEFRVHHASRDTVIIKLRDHSTVVLRTFWTL